MPHKTKAIAQAHCKKLNRGEEAKGKLQEVTARYVADENLPALLLALGAIVAGEKP